MANDTKGDLKNDIGYTEKAYQTSEVAIMLDIAVPTVRKYAQNLERKGYTFIKTKGTGMHQARLFVEKDIMALRYLKDVREQSNLTVDRATSIVIDRFGRGSIQSVSGNDTLLHLQHDKQYTELKELMHRQTEMIGDLSKRLDKQQDYISRRLEERDRLLIQTLRESLETKKQTALPTFKKNFFSRLFSKRF